MALKIKYPETHIYHKYDQQYQAQPMFIQLDADGSFYADWNAEIGNGVPMSVFEGTDKRWSLPSTPLTARAITMVMDMIKDKVEQYHASEDDQERQDLNYEICQEIEGHQFDYDEYLKVFEATEFFEPVFDAMLRSLKGKDEPEYTELSKLMRAGKDVEATTEIERLADDSGECDILESAEGLIEALREKLEEEEEDEA